MPTTPTTSFNERARLNIRVMKAIRNMSDADIAEAASYSSRQMIADRLGGRTPLSLDDVERIAASLGIDPNALLLSRVEMMAWLDANPDYRAPAKPKRGRRS